MYDYKKIRRLIIIVFFIVIVIIALLCTILISNKNKNKVQTNNVITENDKKEAMNNAPTLYTDTSLKELDSTAKLLAIQDIISDFYQNYSDKNINALLATINSEYITSKKIDASNLYSTIVEESGKNYNFMAKNIYQKEISFDKYYKYYVYGTLYSGSYDVVADKMFEIDMNNTNSTFSIIPRGKVTAQQFNEYISNAQKKDTGDKEKVNTNNDSKVIKANNYNKYTIKQGNELTTAVINNYINSYKFYRKNNVEKAYNLLNEKYRTAKYGSLTEYQKYVSQNTFRDYELDMVNFTMKDKTSKYTGVDKNGKYYIIEATSALNYNIMFDSYTSPVEDTVTKYNAAKYNQKAAMCVETVKEMINNKDYKTLYAKLNKDFKANNFSTQAKFADYINQKYYVNNKFEYETAQQSGNNYVIKVKVVNIQDTTKSFSASFVIKLGKGINDFEMAFAMN